MPFQKIQSEKLATSVGRQIELLILRGILRPGERLPSERDLSERMGVSPHMVKKHVVRGLAACRLALAEAEVES